MKQWRTARILMACALLCCCASTESALAPLGFGPLASAERAQREAPPLHNASTQRPKRTPERREGRALTPAPPIASAAATGGTTARDELTSRDASAADTTAPSPLPAEWVGLWHGKDTTRFQIPSFPSEPMIDDNARIRVEAEGNQSISLVLIDSSNGTDLCSLSAQLSGREARISPGQPCFGNEDESMELDVHVKSGQAKLESSTLVVELFMDAAIKSDQLEGRGTVDYHFEGRR